MTSPVFSIVTLTYNRPHYLKQAVGSVLAQTYSHWELVIINNASTHETVANLQELQNEPRVKIVDFERNQYDPKRPMIFMEICCQRALEVVAGDFVLFLSDDDWIAPDYVEKMVRLFLDNPNCISACGLPMSADKYGNVSDADASANKRSRYMPGHLMVLDVLNGGTTLYSSPGSIFAIRTDIRRKMGGFHESFDFADFVSIIPFGETGFDSSAHFYWRHHDDQLNKRLNDEGMVYIRSSKKVIADFDLRNRWDAIEVGLGSRVCNQIDRNGQSGAANLFCYSLYRFKIRACARILSHSWPHLYFWQQIPRLLIKKSPQLKSSLLRTAARVWFVILPFTRKISPRMERIYRKLDS